MSAAAQLTDFERKHGRRRIEDKKNPTPAEKRIEAITRELAEIEEFTSAYGATAKTDERERELQKKLTEAMDIVNTRKRDATVAERDAATELTEALEAVREEFPNYGQIMNRAIFARRAYEYARDEARKIDAPITEPWIPRLSVQAQKERLAGDRNLYDLMRTISSLDLSM
jgi:hypothetical protein